MKKIAGHTGLAAVEGLSQDLHGMLKGLWVESAEEAVAALAALESPAGGLEDGPGHRLSGLKSAALDVIEPARRETITKPVQGGALGCLLDEETLEIFRREGRLSQARAIAPQGLEPMQLPSAVRLMAEMPEVKDQGSRGTCVSFATVALKEFLERRQHDFSEQFLYWGCKELDGHDGPGTWIHTAMSVLNLYGCCRSAFWPYFPEDVPGNEGQGPPPREALEDAAWFRMSDCRSVEESLVLQYKRILAGEGSSRGMPVVFGVLVFNSWYRSSETWRTGKITLPFPGEAPVSGHAMCVVGYVDDVAVPGGGYFIVRNSWSTRWAAESPEAAGHALMPYAYVESYALEAFTGPVGWRQEAGSPKAALPVVLFPADPGFETQYVRDLTTPARDLDGALVPAAAKVIPDPLDASKFKRDTPANRREFSGRDCSWTDTTRQQRWFGKGGEAALGPTEEIDAVVNARREFDAAVGDNLNEAVGLRLPFESPPPWVRLVPWEWVPRIRSCELAADLTAGWIEGAKPGMGLPADLPWPESWKERLASLNSLRVFRLRRSGREVHVVTAFLTPMRRCRVGGAEPQPVGTETLERVERCYREWLGNRPTPELVCYSLGTANGMAASVAGTAGAGQVWILSERQPMPAKVDASAPPSQVWRSRSPELRPGSPLNALVWRLQPETGQQQVLQARRWVAHLEDYAGTVTEGKIAREGGLRRRFVREAFFELQDDGRGKHRIHRTEAGELAIREARDEPVRVGSEPAKPGLFRRHLVRIIGVALAIGVARFGMWMQHRLDGPGWTGIAGWVLCIGIIYVGSLIQAEINRGRDLAEESE